MKLIDADKLVFDYSGLAYINPYDFQGIAKYFAKQIARMPTIEPEIVRCKNCVYYNWDCIDAPYGMTKMIRWCELHYDAGNENLEVNPTDFCKWAERKTDD